MPQPSERTFFIHYNLQNSWGAGDGNTRVTVPAGAVITMDAIRDWERQLREANDWTSCVITNFVELEG